ncbi:DNA gyrase inhibitor YacG [Candidatus Poribacteria bacterium]|nr:DNA gyrase inhibitor YacG [Candidatus Poribacteria bacterium]
MKCSQCGTEYDFINQKDIPLPPNFPFCSKRCKSIDLGKWLNEEYRISTPLTNDEDLETIDNKVHNQIQEDTLVKLLESETDDQ